MKETKFTASDGASGDRFGWIVYIGGDTLLVGDPGKYKWGGGGGMCSSLQDTDHGTKEQSLSQ